jgi:hypoxanthine phosphoribosyltransferase
MEKVRKRIVYSRDEIGNRVCQLAEIISRDYQGGDLVLVGILKGAFIFLADVARNLTIPCIIDFIRAASYGSESVSCGDVVITKDLEIDIAGKDVLLVEDIIDTGITLHRLMDTLRERRPRSLKICALIDKKARREVELDADYVGFVTDDGFLVGYGLDFNEQGRLYPDIYEIEI